MPPVVPPNDPQSWFQLVFDGTSDLMSLHRVEPDGRFVFENINRSLKAFHKAARPGSDPDSWIGRDLDEVMRNSLGFSAAQADNVLSPYREAAVSGIVTPVSHISTGASGTKRYREGVITPLKDPSGRVTHIFYRGTDVTERREAEALLREEQGLTRSMMDNTSDLMGLYRLEPRGMVIEQWNRALQRFYSGQEPPVDAGAWIGRPVEEFLREVSGLDEAGLARRLEPYRRAAATRVPVSYQMSIPSSHGPQHRESVVVPLTDGSGRVTHLFYRGTDVTSRRIAEEELLRSADQFAGMFNLVPNALAIVRKADGRLLAVNEAWLRMYGWSRDESVGRTALELGLWAEPADRAEFISDIERDGRLRPTVNLLRARDGREVTCLSSAEVIEWQGAPALLVSHQDVSELESLRREALANSERFAKVFDISPTPIVVGAVEDGQYLAVNDAWLQLHGYEREELRGEGSLSLGVWADRADRARIVEMVSRGIEVRRVPMRFRKKSGEVFETLYSATLTDWEGRQAIIATPQDVTELKRATEEIRRLNETLEERVRRRTSELEAANRELESFSYSVSHDLRAPLRAMASFSALLAARPAVRADAEAAGHAARIRTAASRMGTIVDALLQFSRLSRQALALRPMDLRAEVDSIIAELPPGGRSVRWVIGGLPEVRGDPALLRLVLQNLIENAFKYTSRRAEAVIEIDASRANHETVVRVRDNGVGFEMQYADKVFGVFERLHADGEFEGTGIGLANAKRIVQRHGGRIWCEAVPGEGAAFYFSVPG